MLGRLKGRTQGRGYGISRGNATKICTFCGRERYTTDVCYYKHGFPSNFGKQRNKNGTEGIMKSANLIVSGNENDMNAANDNNLF
ncbi:hypothetical protein Lalb_Chr08g0234781 [Lupinus albus]|uniref:Transcription factor interactor and regulator CCHC(Zn) family n=1 Tax=Lupinus albus TaxID=3870 RepID=A0A6A4Q332_LUPAL|nr:hypothetical protein Lalb_Chr08g0234781 [Lupinus albus]